MHLKNFGNEKKKNAYMTIEFGLTYWADLKSVYEQKPNVHHSSHNTTQTHLIEELGQSPRAHHSVSFPVPFPPSKCLTKCPNHALPRCAFPFAAALSPFDPFPLPSTLLLVQ